jgi:hypothetical protein
MAQGHACYRIKGDADGWLAHAMGQPNIVRGSESDSLRFFFIFFFYCHCFLLSSSSGTVCMPAMVKVRGSTFCLTLRFPTSLSFGTRLEYLI